MQAADKLTYDSEQSATTARLSWHQERLWFIDRFETGHVYPSHPVYHNIPLILRLHGPVDSELLELALNAVVTRHSALRTNIVLNGETPEQVVRHGAKLKLRIAECSEAGAGWIEWARAESQHPLPLDAGLPVRAALLITTNLEATLVLTVHHAMADRTSLGVIAADIADACTRLFTGSIPASAGPAIEYVDYAEWQRELTPDALEPLLFYWKWQLRAPLPSLELPESRRRPAVHTYTAAIHTFNFEGDVVLKAAALAAQEGSTTSAVLLAAFFALLHRYSGQDDIIVGTFGECRNQPGTETLVGPVANLLPIRNRMPEDATFRVLLANVSRTVGEATAYQELPFDRMVAELNPEKDMSRTVLFDVLLQVNENGPQTFAMGDVTAELIETNLGYGKYDLSLSLDRDGGRFTGTFVYNADIYDSCMIEQITRHYVALLRRACADPDGFLADIDLLSPEETTRQLVTWNSSDATYPETATIHELFSDQVRRTPDAVAVVSESHQLSYAALERSANQLAHLLRELGAAPDTLIAVCLEPSADLIVGLLAVLKSGAAYLPLDPGHPEERRRFTISDARASILITTEVLQQQSSLDVPKAVLLDRDAHQIASRPVTAPANLNSSTDLAYCIYTSGSTGQPKGTLIEHRNVVRLLLNDKLQFSFSGTDVWTLFHSAAFDFSVWEMYGALLYGGKLVIVPKAARRDPVLLLRLLTDERVTVLNQTPSAFLSLVSTIRDTDAPMLHLRYVVFGGEELHPLQLRPFRKLCPEVRLINMYGITETTVHVTFKELNDTDIESNLSNIGVPIPTTRVYITDSHLRLLPPGVIGEICVGGDGVARGYLDREELTRQKFVPNPHRYGERLYRSGDLGKYSPNGELIYLGRIDDQVQIRGFRVELGEIHTRLLQHPSVSRAEVIARAANHTEELVAYVVPSGELSVQSLRVHLSRNLPEYMIPSAFVLLPSLPLTANGKVDRRALPEPEAQRSGLGVGYMAPRNAVEELLVSLWERTLGREQVGIHDNFFELGGHSLLATQLFSRIRDVFSVDLQLRLLFEAPTVAGIADHVQAALRADPIDDRPAVVRTSRSGSPPLSFAQQRLWFLNELDPESSGYNVPAVFHVSGPLNITALEWSLEQIIRRHEVLRSAFRNASGTPVQNIQDSVEFRITYCDLSHESADERYNTAVRIATEDTRRPFDLSIAPLIRATVLSLAPDEHVVAATFHHIVSDAWSTRVFIGELVALYTGRIHGESPLFPDLPVQYADFAAWQREWFTEDTLRSQLEYWRRQLEGAPVSISLPTQSDASAEKTPRAHTIPFHIGADLTARLRQLSRESGATLFMTLLSAFTSLLHRYSGQEDLVVGTPIANRNRSETEGLIGFFVNTLVLRVDLSGQPSFQQLLSRVRHTALDAYAHQDLPFDQLVEALRPDRALNRTPLFQVMFGLQNAQTGKLELPGLTVTPLQTQPSTAKFDLTMMLEESVTELLGALEVNADVFTDETAAGFLEHFTSVLEAVAADPEQRVGTIQLCGADERRRLLKNEELSATRYPRYACIDELFEQQVRKTPDAIAVHFEGEQLTYAEINARADQIANRVRQTLPHSVGPDRRIGICVEQSALMVAAMIAVLKTGSAYVPLDANTPAERLGAILRDADVQVLLTQSRISEELREQLGGIEVVCLDSDYTGDYREPAGFFCGPRNSSQLAYVIYTSGSTGKPKGVAVPHRAVVRLVRNTDYLELHADDAVAQASNSSFDAATFEVWGALLNGARVVGIEREKTLSPTRFAAELQKHRITTLFLTTALFNEIAREVPDAFSGLRYLLFGGEAVTPKWVRLVLENGPPQHLLHVYGPTENTTFSSWHRITNVPAGAITIPIGGAIANTQLYVLDDNYQPVPADMAGELFLGGDGLAWGYLNEPELTAEAFVPHPWSTEPGSRLYRTGDLVRRRTNGDIEFLGRRDHQVKVRGFRIEPGEVEAAILTHPMVRSAIVVSRPLAGVTELAAYVVCEAAARVAAAAGALHSDGGIDTACQNSSETALARELREFVSTRLPAYMVPASFTVLDAFPLNANGKVDRSRLPAPDRMSARRHVTPRTATEEILCDIWATLLELSEAGVDDNFFELGGHSLLATQLRSRIREVFGVELPLWCLFESPTPAGLGLHIDSPPEQSSTRPVALLPVPRSGDLPLSFAQERLWFLDQLEPGNPFYNVALGVRIRGAVNPEALESALQYVVARHEALRTTFPAVAGKASQKITGTMHVPVERHDLSRVVPGEQQQQIQLLAEAEARRTFDLATGPLIRATFIKVAATEHVLLLTMHHIVSDGWSLGVLLREISTVYMQLVNGVPVSLPPLPIQYTDFAWWQREWLQGETLETQLDYWKAQLAGVAQTLQLPSDRPRPRVQTFQGSSEELNIGPEVTLKLRSLSRQSGTTMFMTLYSAFAALLQRYSGQEDIVIGTPIANRTRAEIEHLIGFFVNTLALRFDGSGNPSFSELLSRTRRMALDAYAHQDLPFERLVDELGIDRDLSRNPLFQVMFALQNAPMRLPAVPGLQLSPLSTRRVAAQFDIVLDAWETSEGIRTVWEYNTDLFDAETIRRMAKHFRRVLEAVADSPELRISQLPLLDASECQHMLDVGRGAEVDHPFHRCIQDSFEELASAVPDRIAAVHNDTRINYAELNARANQIAHSLRSSGVGKQHRVAILEDRGIDFLAAVLGVLKAGAAFLPVDPQYPPERIEYMISDSQVQVLITGAVHAEKVPFGSGTNSVTSVLRFDDRTELERHPRTNPNSVNTADDLAYMLYTSGSTGLPKGALVRHNGAVNHIFAQFEELRFHSGTAFLQSAPCSSDISVWQFLAPLLIGGRTVIADFETVCDPAALLRTIRTHEITLIELVPVVLQGLLTHAAALSVTERALPSLEWAMVTGEMVAPALVKEWFDIWPGIPLVNAYGPTEAADDICQALLTGPLGPDEWNVPVGRPLANLCLYVLDPYLNLVPSGAQGEVCVSGVGVGAGYWRREQQTLDSFVRNPYLSDPLHSVLYRTGDLGRWRHDGALEVIGRIDNQVKISGFRIELGEIEGVLSSHPGVRQTAVVAWQDPHREKRLVAHVVPESVNIPQERQADQVSLWESLHDNDYGGSSNDVDPTFNTVGWDNTYTGLPLSQEEMLEYVGGTIDRILAHGARRILEIGCGTGLLAFRLVPRCEQYVGLDLSSVAIDRLRKTLGSGEHAGKVTLLHRQADDLISLPSQHFDAVVINSVIQYFPSAQYLVRTLTKAVECVRPGGTVFVGDVRDLRLLETYHTSVQLFKAAGTLPLDELRRRIHRQLLKEQELLVHPDLFAAFRQQCPAVSSVNVEPKPGRFVNELTAFRYDVTLHVNGSASDLPALPGRTWSDSMTDQDLARELITADQDILTFHGVINSRIQADLRAQSLLQLKSSFNYAGQLREAVSETQCSGVDPQRVWSLAAELGWSAYMSCASTASSFDVVFSRKALTLDSARVEIPHPATEWTIFTNDPLREKVQQDFTREIQSYLKSRLPKHMVPAFFVMAETLPLTPAGKVDRNALPAPDITRVDLSSERQPPATPTEHAVAAIWRDVLGLDEVGIQDDFFVLGGHSLKATQVVSQVYRRLGVQIPVREVFNRPTIAELAVAIDSETGADFQPIKRVPDAPDYPLSHAQRRLWVLSQMDAASRAYNMPAALLLDGEIDENAFDSAVRQLAARHESLRTSFEMVNGEPRQRIHSALPLPTEFTDLSSSPDAEQRARELARNDAINGFDLQTGPLFRVHLIRIAEHRHVLLFNVHHIVSDDRSMNVIVRDFGEFYRSARKAVSPALNLLPIQYRDYAAWQQEFLASEITGQDRAYWHRKLAGDLSVLDLPTDFRRPSEKTYNGDTVHFNIGFPLTGELQAFCRQHDVTLFMTLLAAVKALLFRYTGQQDIIVGSPVEGRTHADLDEQVGFFVNMLVLRDTVNGYESFTELLMQVRQTVTEALDHQNYPFDRLVDELRLDRDVSRSPMFDVVVVLQNPEGQELALPGVRISSFSDEFGVSKYDLAFNFEVRPDGLAVVLVYNTDLFVRSRIERLGMHLETLLSSAVANSRTAVQRLRILGAREQEQLLRYSNSTAETASANTIVRMFAEQAAKTPLSIAVTRDDRSLTYGELDDISNRCAHYLRAQGIGPDTLVGICMERSVEMIVGLLAILKAGGAYVPFDLSYPRERLAFIRNDSGTRVILTEERFADVCRSLGATVLCLDSDQDLIARHSDAALPVDVTSGHLAYVIYTSGSTGQPKGVQVTHGNVTRLFTSTHRWFQFGPQDVWTMFHSYAFDFSVWEVWGALLYGGRLVVVPYLTSRSPDAFYELLQLEGVTVLNQTPVAFRQLMQADEASRGTLSLRLVVFGGEALDIPGLQPWFERHGDAVPKLVNMYGITETTVHVTYRPVTAGDARTPASMVGFPIPDLSLHILDAAMQPVPIGVTGQMYVGGAGVARGYLNRPDLTAERFVPNPFTSKGERLYNSGDLARWHENGDIEYLGRADNQVKIRGFRIELGEIATVLNGHPSVQESVVTTQNQSHGDYAGEKRLVAYVIPHESHSAGTMDMRAYLHERLPEHMVPHQFVVLQSGTRMPLTQNGKLDVREIQKLTAAAVAPSAPSEIQLPRNTLEKTIAVIWREILGSEAIGIHENFFEAGGDSVAIIQVHDRLRNALNRDIPVTMLFRFPTIGSLAENLGRTGTTEAAADDIQRRARQQVEARQKRNRRGTT